MQNLPNYFTTPNKMTSENDIKGLVSLQFLRPWERCFSALDRTARLPPPLSRSKLYLKTT
jgi:hypothetical protein